MIIKDKTWFYAVVSGTLLFLSFPKFGCGLIAFIALIPLFFVLQDTNPRRGLVIGFVTGLIFNIGLIYWIVYVVVKYGYLPYYVGIGAMFLMASYLSIYTAFFAFGISYFNNRGIPQLVTAPILWTSLEYFKSQLFTGFPWENLGYSQYLNHYFIQLADITGVYGLSFIVVSINAVLFNAILLRNKRKQMLGLLSAGIALLLLVYGYGVLRVEHIRQATDKAAKQNVLLVQGNIEQDVKWNPQYQKETLDIYGTLSKREPSRDPGIIIWPETAAPFFFQDVNAMHRQIAQVAKSSHSWLLFGSPAYKNEGGGNLSIYNSAFLLSPESDIVGRYDKMHLVPFGEYVPLRRFLPFINKLVVGVGDFQKGQGYLPVTAGQHKLGVLICYEGILPEAARAYKMAKSDLLVNITNDAWFGKTSAPYQHLSMAALRAIENRLYLVRAANTGISAIVDPTGKIVTQTAIFEKTTLQGEVKYVDEKTFYGSYGDVFIYLILISAMIMIVILFIKGRKKHV